ncbi:zinc/iron-chelating domain-containing protein [Desulforhopalus sp. 52FAK]
MLELALSPYDVLRLRHSTGKNSSELLNEYIIQEQDPGEPFPRFYLTMVDDGRASCVFVAKDGCTIYKDRPAACRTYPLGRAAQLCDNGSVKQHFIVIEEHHCQGFQEKVVQTPLEYTKDQELEQYNCFNDAVAAILQHKAIRQGFIPSKKQVELFTLALYDLDRFRQMIVQADLDVPETDGINIDNDEQLLKIAISWVKTELYSNFLSP